MQTSKIAGGSDLRERKRRDSRAATVEAAFDLFAQRGYDQVTVADICEAANIGRRTFFRYFATKDDVLTEPAREMGLRVAEIITLAPREEPDGSVIRRALISNVDYALHNRDRLRQIVDLLHSSANASWSPFMRLSEQETRVATQLSARHGLAEPDWQTRVLVARAIAAFRIWLDDLNDDSARHDRDHLDEIFDFDPLL